MQCWNLRMFQLKYLPSSTETLNWAWWRCNGRLSFFFWISNYNSTPFYLTFIKRIIIWILKCDWHWHDLYLRYICIVQCKYFHIYIDIWLLSFQKFNQWNTNMLIVIFQFIEDTSPSILENTYRYAKSCTILKNGTIYANDF